MCSTQFILGIVGLGFCFGVRADRSRQHNEKKNRNRVERRKQNPRFRNKRKGTKTRKHKELFEELL